MSAFAAQPVNQVRPVRRASAMRRRRARTLRVLALLVVLAGVLFVAPRAFTKSQGESLPTITYKVERGDTLWDIAARHNSGQDVRRVIDRIKQANGLKTATVHPGQTLVIPQGGR